MVYRCLSSSWQVLIGPLNRRWSRRWLCADQASDSLWSRGCVRNEKRMKKRRQKEGGWLIKHKAIKPYFWQLCSFAGKIQMDVSSRPTTWIASLLSEISDKSAVPAEENGKQLWAHPWKRKWQPTPIFLPGKIPWTEESCGLQSMGPQRARLNRATEHTH